MSVEEYYFPSSNNKNQIHCQAWVPVKPPKAALFISHGMSEYINRYADFASTLAKEGYFVAGHDHIGHGSTAASSEERGHFEKGGNAFLLSDIDTHIDMIRERLPEVPVFILGHSMGSFLARQYISQKSDKLNGAIIIGTGHQSKIATNSAKLICNLIKIFKNDRFRSKMIQQAAFSKYLSRIENPATKQDWLTKDKNIIYTYFNDGVEKPCFTVGGYHELFHSVNRACDKSNAERIRKDLPILIISGSEDPVGDFGKGVEKTYKLYKSVNIKNIKFKLYKNDRHEILNELDRVIIYGDIMDWIDEVIDSQGALSSKI